MADTNNIDNLPPPPEMGAQSSIDSLPPPPDSAPRVDTKIDTMPAPPDAPYADEDSLWENIKQHANMDTVVQGAKKAWKGLTGTLSLGMQGLDIQRRLTTGNIIAALDPEAKRRVDKALAEQGENPQNIKTFYDIDRALNKVAPDLYVSSYVVPKVRKALNGFGFKAFGQDWKTQIVGEDDANLIALGTGIVADVLTDPLTIETFGASLLESVPKAISRADELKTAWETAKKEGKLGTKMLESSLKDIPKPLSLAEQVQNGERTMIALKAPFSNKVLPILPKSVDVKVAGLLDEIGKSKVLQEAKRKLPMLQLKTGFQVADDAASQHTVGEAAHKVIRQELAQRFGQATDEVKNVVNAFADYGEEKGLQFLKDSGLKHSEQDLFAGKRLYQALQDEVTKAKAYAEMHGVDIKEFEAATADERYQLREAIKHQFGGEIPKELEPYLFREQYGLPRQMKREALMAEQTLAQKENAWTKDITGGGRFKLSPSSAKESEKYSTMVMNKIKESKTGMIQSFEADPIQRVLDRTEDIYRSVADKKYIDTIKEYGGTREELTQKILEARTFVKNAKEIGAPVPPEIRQWASVNPKNLRSMGEYPWNRIRGYVEFDKETQAMRRLIKENPMLVQDLPPSVVKEALDPGKVRILRDNIVFPPEIVVGVENRLGLKGMKQDNAILRGLEWVNNQWKKSTLLNPLRLFREGGENASVYMMMGGNPKYLPETAADLLKYSPTLENNGASAFTTAAMATPFVENIATDMKAFNKPMTYEQATNINTNGIPFSQIIHDTAKQGRLQAFDELLGLTKESLPTKAGKWNPLRIIDFINDNHLAKAGREFFGGINANLNKIALAKTYHFDKGIPFAKAMDMADHALISFHDVNPALRQGNLFTPFLTYHVRNIQRMPVVFASSPAGFTFYNKVKQAWANAGDWKADDQAAFKHIVGNHFQPDPIIGPLLKGTDSMANDAKWFADFGSYIGKKVFGDGYKQGMDDKVMVITAPDPFLPAADLFDPERAVDNLSPLMKATLAIAGVDPFTGDQLPYHGTTLDAATRAETALKQINPLNFTQAMKAYNVAIQAIEPEFVNHMVNLGMDKDNAEDAYDLVYGDGKTQRKNMQKAYQTIFNWSTLGFGRVTNIQLQAAMKTIGLAKDVKKLMMDYRAETRKKGFNEFEKNKAVNAIKRTMKDIQFNAEMVSNYNDAIDGARKNMGDLQEIQRLQEESGNAIQEGLDDGVIQPQEQDDTPEDGAPGPQSSMPIKGDRKPAMASGLPLASDLLTRGSMATRANLKPNYTQQTSPSDEEKQRQQEAVFAHNKKGEAMPQAEQQDSEYPDMSASDWGDEENDSKLLRFFTKVTGDHPKGDVELEYAVQTAGEAIDQIDKDMKSTEKEFLKHFEDGDIEHGKLIYKTLQNAKRDGIHPAQVLEELVKHGEYYMPTLDDMDEESKQEDEGDTVEK